MRKILAKGFLISFSMSCLADNTSDGDLFALTFEELLNVEVITSSGDAQTVRDAPSVISVITAEQLQSYGYQDLYDILNLLPGINKVESYFGYSTLNFRGILQEHYNNKVLFMINGHPLPERTFGSSHLEYMPLEGIERIEVIRGPASSLYGTNAMLGVVNIITKQQGQSQLNSRVGSNGYLRTGYSYFGENISVSLSSQNYDGYRYEGVLDEAGNPVSLDYQNDINNLHLQWRYEDWQAQLGWFEQNKAKFGMNPFVWQGGISNNESLFVDLSKNISWQDNDVKIMARYDEFDKDFDAGEFPSPGAQNRSRLTNKVTRFGLDVNWDMKLSEVDQLVLGLTYDYDDTSPLQFNYVNDGSVNPFSPFLQDYDMNNDSVFAQWQRNLSNSVNLIAGLRFEENSDTGSSGPLPRLGVVWQSSDDITYKFLYGRAFRSPVFLEKFAFTPSALFGNPNLDNELANTLEAVMDWRISNNQQLILNIYRLEIEDEIKRRPATNDPTATEFFNGEGRWVNGIEAAYDWRIAERINLTINADYKQGESDGLNYLNFTEEGTLAVMLGYGVGDRGTLNMVFEAVSDRQYRLNNGDMGEVAAYQLLNLNYQVQTQQYGLFVGVHNLLDQHYTFPENVRRNIPEVPGSIEREFRLGATWYFN
ncbi:MAG: TonB-dependent receptor [Kangiellaceae bacterium]|nr:TonB-dependent receptor [Kangiellaceae bacterium]